MIRDIDEEIKYCKDKAEELKNTADLIPVEGEYDKREISECLDCAEEHEQLAEWLEELKARREADRWIPVSERLPDKNGNYLVCLNNGEITTDIFEEEELFMGFWGYMTAWRPLPKPYESEGEE